METNSMQPLNAPKSECQMPTLAQILQRLKAEMAMVTAELSAMPADAWLNVRGRALANREQELHTTLDVLQRMTQLPVQIQEPAR